MKWWYSLQDSGKIQIEIRQMLKKVREIESHQMSKKCVKIQFEIHQML